MHVGFGGGEDFLAVEGEFAGFFVDASEPAYGAVGVLFLEVLESSEEVRVVLSGLGEGDGFDVEGAGEADVGGVGVFGFVGLVVDGYGEVRESIFGEFLGGDLFDDIVALGAEGGFGGVFFCGFCFVCFFCGWIVKAGIIEGCVG